MPITSEARPFLNQDARLKRVSRRPERSLSRIAAAWRWAEAKAGLAWPGLGFRWPIGLHAMGPVSVLQLSHQSGHANSTKQEITCVPCHAIPVPPPSMPCSHWVGGRDIDTALVGKKTRNGNAKGEVDGKRKDGKRRKRKEKENREREEEEEEEKKKKKKKKGDMGKGGNQCQSGPHTTTPCSSPGIIDPRATVLLLPLLLHLKSQRIVPSISFIPYRRVVLISDIAVASI